MSRPGALLLITAGVVLGSHYLFPESDMSGDLAEVTRISISSDSGEPERDVIPTFAPTGPAYREIATGSVRPAVSMAMPKPSTWTSVVTPGRPVVRPVRSPRPADPQTRMQLARDLQHELRRVGCYHGAITGTWTAATRRAMATFMDRANAVLPYAQPDYVLLALVQGHQEIACSAVCPSGQVMQDGGRCVPEAVVAQAAKQQRQLEVRRSTVARLEQESARERVVETAPTEREELPWLQNQPVSLPAPPMAVTSRPDPLPGRMAIGGPVPPPETMSPSAVPPRPGNPAVGAEPRLAALQQYEADVDDLADDRDAATAAIPSDNAEADPPSAHKGRTSRRSDGARKRRYESYASSGKRRRGDPRPGTARFNLMQSLGGVY